MAKFKKILCPTDFSEHSTVAIEYVKELAVKFGGSVHCVHVVDDSYQYWLGAGENAVPIVAVEQDLVSSSEMNLTEYVKKKFADFKGDLQAKVLSGRPFVEIIRYAQAENIDVIVMGTHGHGAIASMLLGSVTEKVVRKAPCPVLTVRHPEHKFEMP